MRLAEGFRESISFSEYYDNKLNLNRKYIEGKVWVYYEKDFSKNDENDYFVGEYLNGEIWNF